MNPFKRLCWLVQEDMMSPEIDMLVCELVSSAAAAGHTICLGLVKPEDIRLMYPLIYLFFGYGMQLTSRIRKEGDALFVFLSHSPQSEAFEGTVRERPV